jgi:hypothetical protein
MKNTYTNLTLAAASMLLCAGAHATIVLVDFGDGNSTTLPSQWNASIRADTGASNLVDTTGSATTWDVSFGGGLSDSGTTGHLGTRTVTPTWSDASNNALDDRVWLNAGQSGTMTLSDLDVNLTYDIEIFSSYADGSGGRGSATHTMTDAGGAVEGFNASTDVSRGTTVAWATNLEGANAEEGWLGWYDMTPDSNGRIILSISVPSSGDDINPRGALNAMQITAVPEPATYAALLGLLALGFAIRSRHR